MWGAHSFTCTPRLSPAVGWRKCSGGGSWEASCHSVPSLLCLAQELDPVVQGVGHTWRLCLWAPFKSQGASASLCACLSVVV